MIKYDSLSTAELIDLLFQEEDRVTPAHLEAIARRGGEALPRLREILLDEDYWYEGQRGEYWIELHVVTLLGMIGDPAVLPDLISMIMPSYYADFDWLLDYWGEVLGSFGPPAVEPLIDFIRETKGAFRDNSDYSEARIQAATALTFIAHEHPAEREKVLHCLLELLNDPAEDDIGFLSLLVECPLYLDRQHSLKTIQEAYRRGVVDPGIAGSYQDLIAHATPATKLEFFRRKLPAFYQPKEIARRQVLWARPDVHEAVDTLRDQGADWVKSTPFPPPLEHFYPKPHPHAPASAETKVGRNDPCPCGSGKKYKHCHGKLA